MMESIFFKDQGNGFPIVLLHGFCETHQIWDGVASELAKDFRVITPDLPGFGKSQLLLQSFSIDDIGELLAEWLISQAINNPVVIGHSLGGYVALAMAQKRTVSLSGLGLFHSTPLADSEEKKVNRNKTIDFVIQNGIAPFVETFVPGLFYQKENSAIHFVREMALTTPVKTLTGYSKAMRDRPSREDFLKSYTGPFMIGAGVHDSVIPFLLLQQASQWVAKTMFFALENTGHMGMFESQSDTIKYFRGLAEWCQREK
jgi:pimeloyl-ACP methyl ester carboxylesterase